MNGNHLIFTDGASRGNPGPGGWGAIIVAGQNVTELGDGDAKTTNNRMELAAATEAIKKTPVGAKIKLYTDSGYLINGITKWVHGWIRNDWKTKEKNDVLNKDIWQELYNAVQDREVNWFQVKGHAGIAGNDRADKIATACADGENPHLFKGSIRNYEHTISEPTEEDMDATSDNERRKARAYSYLSLVDGKLEKHDNWPDCEARVKGKSDVKFRKSISAKDEIEIMKSWGLRK
jgi:ribonuclease HI